MNGGDQIPSSVERAFAKLADDFAANGHPPPFLVGWNLTKGTMTICLDLSKCAEVPL